MMDGPFFSVVIPTFNRERFVVDAVRSALAQSFSEFETIVVDDGSTDGTLKALAPFSGVLQVVTQSNQGVSAARNTGARVARGRWLAFLDSDDEWQPRYLEVQHRHLQGEDRVVVQGTDCWVRQRQEEPFRYFCLNGAAAEFRGQPSLVIDEALCFAVRHAPWQIGSVVIDKRAFRESGGFDESLCISEDLDLIARLCVKGRLRLVAEPLVTVHHRDEVLVSLSRSAASMPLMRLGAHERIFEALSRLDGVTPNDLRELGRARSANRRAMGNHLRHCGRYAAAYREYWRSFRVAPSFRSLAKLLIPALTHRGLRIAALAPSNEARRPSCHLQ